MGAQPREPAHQIGVEPVGDGAVITHDQTLGRPVLGRRDRREVRIVHRIPDQAAAPRPRGDLIQEQPRRGNHQIRRLQQSRLGGQHDGGIGGKARVIIHAVVHHQATATLAQHLGHRPPIGQLHQTDPEGAIGGGKERKQGRDQALHLGGRRQIAIDVGRGASGQGHARDPGLEVAP